MGVCQKSDATNAAICVGTVKKTPFPDFNFRLRTRLEVEATELRDIHMAEMTGMKSAHA